MLCKVSGKSASVGVNVGVSGSALSVPGLDPVSSKPSGGWWTGDRYMAFVFYDGAVCGGYVPASSVLFWVRQSLLGVWSLV